MCETFPGSKQCLDGNYAKFRYRYISKEKNGSNNLSTAFTLKATLIPIHSEVLLILEQHQYTCTMYYMILVLGKFQCRDKCLCLLMLFSNIPVLWVKIKNQEILQTFYYVFCLYMYLPLIFLLFSSSIHFIQLPLKLMFILIALVLYINIKFCLVI